MMGEKRRLDKFLEVGVDFVRSYPERRRGNMRLQPGCLWDITHKRIIKASVWWRRNGCLT